MALTPFWPPTHLAEVPLVPGADEARQWAKDELAQQVYQDAKPGFAEQILALLQKVWDELINSVGAVDGTAGLVIAIGVVLLIVPALGRTAVEITADLERAFPAHKLALRHGAELFSAVRYGQVPPTSAMFAELVDTDQAVSATSPQYGDVFAAVQP